MNKDASLKTTPYQITVKVWNKWLNRIKAIRETVELGEASRRILAALDGINAKTCSLTFNELAWAALRKVDMMTTVKVCRAILGLKGLDIVPVDFGDVWKMTENMERFGLKPRDAIHLAVMQRLGERIIVSEDGHFDTAEVKRIPIENFARSI